MWENETQNQAAGANAAGGDKKKILVMVVAVSVVVAVVAGVLWRQFGTSSPEAGSPPGSEGTTQMPVPENGLQTRTSVPANTVVPEVGSDGVPDNVAVPEAVSPVRAGVAANNRVFDIKAESDKFIPDTVIVKVGDEVKINITAVDKDYAFTQPDYGFNVAIPKGQKKLIPFMGSAEGKFTFYCGSCGGPTKGPVGYVIVTSK